MGMGVAILDAPMSAETAPVGAGGPAWYMSLWTRDRPALLRGAALGAILLLSVVLQFYRLNDWQYFSDDQATQLNVMHGLLVDHHAPLRGLALSVGQAHIGPLFYYMLTLPLWLGQLDPTAGVAMIGLFQAATVYLLYRLCRRVGLPWAGLCVAALYASSELVVYWSRFLWPNTAPFFVVLALYALVALAQGRGRYLVLLAGSLAAVVQMQPTAVLMVPVATAWVAALLVTRHVRVTRRTVLASVGLALLLFAPIIAYDLTHAFAETRAWLAYGTTVQPGATQQRGLRHGVAAFELFAWRLVGFRTRGPVDLLLGLATLATAISATGVLGRGRAVLARLLLVTGALYLLAFSLYRGTLHPHYAEPIYAVPFLAIGLLVDLVVSAPARVADALGRGMPAIRAAHLLHGRWRQAVPGLAHYRVSDSGRRTTGAGGQRTALPDNARVPRVVRSLLYVGTAVVVLGLVTANVRHLWTNNFALDLYQLDSPADAQGNRTGLGEMRQAVALIARDAVGRPYDFLTAVRDGSGGGYEYLVRHSENPPAATPNLPLQYLLVQPADRPPWLWPVGTRARWSVASGAFARLPHLLLWRLSSGHGQPRAVTSPWRTTADVAGLAATIAVDPSATGTLLAGYLGGGARSTDGGRHWQSARWPVGANGLAVISGFAWSAACPRQVYAGTFDGVVRSADGGRTWTPAGDQQPSAEVLSIRTPPGACNTVLAGTRAGIARSVDGGHSWRLVVVGGQQHLAVHSLVVGPDGHTLYAGTTNGVWATTDGGRTWRALFVRGEPRPALSLLVRPFGTPVILAGTGSGIVYSGDGGRTWGPTGGGLQGTVYALLADGRSRNLLAGTDAGLYLSRDTGASWHRVSVPPELTVSALTSDNQRALYAASNQGVYRSLDDGVNWVPLHATR